MHAIAQPACISDRGHPLIDSAYLVDLGLHLGAIRAKVGPNPFNYLTDLLKMTFVAVYIVPLDPCKVKTESGASALSARHRDHGRWDTMIQRYRRSICR